MSQARIADIEANPGVVSTEQILNILQFLGADLVVRVASTGTPASGARPVSTAPADRGRASSIPELFGEEATFGRGAW